MLMKLNGCFLEMKRLCVLLLFIVNNNYFVRATKDDWPSVNDRDLFSCSSSNNLWIQSKFPTATALDIDEQCLNHTRQYLDAYRNRRSWAVKMYESSGRLEEDLIYSGSGNIHHETGLFDQCVSIQPDDVPFQGQYCTVFFGLNGLFPKEIVDNYLSDPSLINDEVRYRKEGEPNQNVSAYQMPSVSFCLPSTCSVRDLRWAVAQRVGHRLVNNMNLSLVTISNEDYCYTRQKLDDSKIPDTPTLVVIAVFCLFGLLVITATVHECWRNRCDRAIDNDKEKYAVRVLHCFSALRNGRTMIATKADVKDVSLSSLHGIRFLTTCWIVLLHTSEEFTGRNSYNKNMAMENVSRLELQGLINGSIAVDTFFFMSGLLVAFSQLGQLDRSHGIFNIKRFYIRRYLRLTPMYASVIALLATVFRYVGNGPDWNYVQIMSQTVRKNWWTNMLYINNYVPKIHHCMNNPLTGMAEAWYLACDMQMFWVSPLFIYPLWRWKKTGFALTVTTFCALIAVTMTIIILQDLPPSVLFSRPKDMAKLDEYCTKVYLQTYTRFPAYLLGILLGWILDRTRNKKLIINKYVIVAGWTLASLIGLSSTYGMVPYLDEEQVPEISLFIRALYGSLHRSAWAAVVGWMVFACTHGYGGFIQSFLSWKCFIPLARLSYAVYLVHFAFVKAYTSQQRKPLYFTEMNFITNYVGVVTFVFFLATILCVGIEISFLNVDKLIFPNKAADKQSAIANTSKGRRAKTNDEEAIQLNIMPRE